ncbi:MAG TPA: phasin family protein [Steroidobacteraceae bacterium]|nr:phasin family protein [Steroidobacteraceae bacterium]
MAIKLDDYSAYTDVAKRAFAPVTRLNETLAGNLERLARFQYELAGEFMQFGLDQLNAAVHARDLGTLLTRQADIANRFTETMAARQQSFARVATQAQASLAQWVEETTSPPGPAA